VTDFAADSGSLEWSDFQVCGIECTWILASVELVDGIVFTDGLLLRIVKQWFTTDCPLTKGSPAGKRTIQLDSARKWIYNTYMHQKGITNPIIDAYAAIV
jgi:hypothetical protein